ncbi:uncharacterized protein LOC132307704 isoform X1 [Cornus florida]|uniref:uncharacterized protein LOC132307704 isoform X1 n=1 Tax=Cornus florida TaxID=4283 RepID=UPI00289CFBFE|nr:uncharacterized protein LOC132307704 isoform X1 [Cornus florida]
MLPPSLFPSSLLYFATKLQKLHLSYLSSILRPSFFQTYTVKIKKLSPNKSTTFKLVHNIVGLPVRSQKVGFSSLPDTMEFQDFFYETLNPLSATDQTPPPPPPLSDDSEPYVVFRNQISLSTIHCQSPETAAHDYFSLDVGADDTESEETLISTPAPASSPASTRKLERQLEGGWFRANSGFRSPMLQLHREILDFCEFLSPTPEEQATRKTAVDIVFDVIRYIWPNCKIEVFGSFGTGLYLPTSDIDVVILGSEIKTPKIGLQALSRALSQRGIAKKIQVIAKARVPIIKFVEKKSGVAFDISFDLQNGPKAAEFIKDAVSKWPPLRPLCLILKVFLQQRELNEVYSGGIGSYALLIMLIATLRNLHENQASPEHNLGILLVKFFDIYGRKLNTSDVGVSCKGEGTFFLKSTRGMSVNGQQMLIAIEDPQAPANDVGKNSFNYYQVRSAFAMAFSALTNAKTILSLGPNRSILGTIIRPDPVLLERKGGISGEVTFDKLLPGAGELLSSGKKRKKSKEKQPAKKVKTNREAGKRWQEESGTKKEKGTKKKRWKQYI